MFRTPKKHQNAFTSLAGAALAVALLGACGTEAADAESSDPAASESSLPGESAAYLSVEDPWVKSAQDGMTAAFGTLVNSSDQDITVVSAASDITSMMELHETVADDDGSMVMRPKDDGFVVPAGGTHELSPGGDHLMVMDLTRALAPGEDVTFTLEMSDGSTRDIAATVKDFDGADEEYQSDMDMDEMDMEMGQG